MCLKYTVQSYAKYYRIYNAGIDYYILYNILLRSPHSKKEQMNIKWYHLCFTEGANISGVVQSINNILFLCNLFRKI